MTTPDTPTDIPDSTASHSAVELLPINFTAYEHHPDLDTETHIQVIADLLAPYGVDPSPWQTPAKERDRQAVENRLGSWKRPAAPQPSGNTLLYWVGHGSAAHLAHYRTPAPVDDGVTPQDIARAIGSRQVHPAAADNWAIVVLDACYSSDFARSVHIELLTKYPAASRYLLLSTAARGPAELGAFARILERALTVTFRGQPAIGLAALGAQLARSLDGYRSSDTVHDDRHRLVRITPDAAIAVSAPLDQLAEIQAVIDQLPIDEQRHFVPKASGAELGELAWYFHGRTLERDHILHWLNTATHGALVVTGRAGAGKSALLGHILLHTRTRLRDILIRYEHLQPLPQGVACPQDPFDIVAHLAGLTLARTVELIATAADLPDIARDAESGQPAADLADRLIKQLHTRETRLTLLLDALDEAEQPLTIANVLLQPLACLPTIRVIIGTRSSTHEGPDQPAPANTNILDALRPPPLPADIDRQQAAHIDYVDVVQDREAFAGYLRAKLIAAKLDIDDEHIANAVLLLAGHHKPGTEPQQFLYVRLAAHELLRNPDLITDPSPLIGQTHRQLFTRAVNRLHHTHPAYTPLLQALGLAQGRGIPDHGDIWAVSASALAPTATAISSAIPELLRDAAPYLALDEEYGQTVYRLAHRTFAEHFANAPGIVDAHAALCTALTQHAQQTLDTPAGETTVLTPPDINPYIRHHLAGHARLAKSFQILANHLGVLDALDLTSITAAVNHLPAHALPPAIAGTVLLQHHAHSEPTSDEPAHRSIVWRQWWRRLGTTYIQGTAPPAEAPPPISTGPCSTVLTASVERRQLSLQLTGHIGSVGALVAFTTAASAPRLATIDASNNNGSVQIWDPATGQQDGEIYTKHVHGISALVAFTGADGASRLATAGTGGRYGRGRVHIWDPATGEQDGEIQTEHAHVVSVMVAFTAADGTPRLATAGNDGIMHIWNPATGQEEGEIHTAYRCKVDALAIFTAADGAPRLATTGGRDGGRKVHIWNLATGQQEGEIRTAYRRKVDALAIFTAADGAPRLATTGGRDGGRKVHIWNLATGQQEGEIQTEHAHVVSVMVAFTAAGNTPRLATASTGDGARVSIWDPITKRRSDAIYTGYRRRVEALVVFTESDGTPRMVTESGAAVQIWNPMVQIRDSPEGRTGAIHIDNSHRVEALVVFTGSDGAPRTATTDGRCRMVRIWNPTAGRHDVEIHTAYTHKQNVLVAFAAADGAPRLATAGDDGVVHIWDPTTGQQDGKIHTAYRRKVDTLVAFALADGTPRLATTGGRYGDGRVHIWNPATGRQDGKIHTAYPRRWNAMAIFAATDGTPRLATASTGGRYSDRMVHIWDPATGQQDGEIYTKHVHGISALVAFTGADGTPRLATASTGGRYSDRMVHIWNPATGQQDGEIQTEHAHVVSVMVAFTAADGTPRLATTGTDGRYSDRRVHIWNPVTGGAGQTLPLDADVLTLAAGHELLAVGSIAGHFVLRMA